MSTLSSLMVKAELRKVLSRASGQAGLLLSALLALGAVLALYKAGDMTEASVNGQMVAQMVEPEVAKALSWALIARNFFVLNMILLMVTGQLMAGEIADHTLRTVLVRPVSRAAILGAKFTALGIYAAMTLAVTAGVTLVSAAALFSFNQPLGPVLLGFAASLLSDLGIIALGLLLSVLMRSVVWVVVGTVLFLLADRALAGLIFVTALAGLPELGTIGPFLPGSALGSWKGYVDGWDWVSFAGLAVFLTVSYGLAWLRFDRADVG